MLTSARRSRGGGPAIAAATSRRSHIENMHVPLLFIPFPCSIVSESICIMEGLAMLHCIGIHLYNGICGKGEWVE